MRTNAIRILILLGLCGNWLDASAQSHILKNPAGYDDGVAERAEFRVSLGSQCGSPFDKAILFDLGGGYNIDDNLYIGLSTGVYPYFGALNRVESDAVIPMMADFSCRLNNLAESWSPFVQIRGGYLAHMKPSTFFPDTSEPYTRKGYTAFEIGGGACYRILRNVDLRMSLNYALAIPGKDDYEPAQNCTEHLLQARVGFGFRGKPKSPTRSEMLEEVAKKNAERQQEYEKYWAEKAAQEEAERQKEEEERAERRRQREANGQNSLAESLGLTANMPSVEFFCHVTESMVTEGASLENKLINLASLAAGKQVVSIVILGITPNENSLDASNVIDANRQADKVKNYLNKRYVIDKNLMTTAFSGFEEKCSKETRPKNAIATIMIEKVGEKK